jgi:hypothetical protein
MAQRDFSHTQVVCISSKLNGRGGGQQDRAATGLMAKKHQNRFQNIIFDIMSKVQKDSKDVSALIGNFFIDMIYMNFVQNFMSKLTRSTLTSPGTIRVK